MKILRLADVEKCVGCGLCMFACSRKNVKDQRIGVGYSGIRSISLSGFERGATVIFCHACPEPPCAEVCPSKALRPRKGGGVIYNEKICLSCHNCISACKIGAIFERDDGKIAVCIHCGYCVDFCPHGVLEVVEA